MQGVWNVNPSKKRRQPPSSLQMFRCRPLVEMLEERLPPGSLTGPMDSLLARMAAAQTGTGSSGGAIGGATDNLSIGQFAGMSGGSSTPFSAASVGQGGGAGGSLPGGPIVAHSGATTG